MQIELWLNTTKGERYHAKRSRLSMYLVIVHGDVEERSRRIGCFEHVTLTGDPSALRQLDDLFPQSEFNEFLQP